MLANLVLHHHSFAYNLRKMLLCIAATRTFKTSQEEKRDFVTMMDMGGEL
jgi:hypothetical protein